MPQWAGGGNHVAVHRAEMLYANSPASTALLTACVGGDRWSSHRGGRSSSACTLGTGSRYSARLGARRHGRGGSGSRCGSSRAGCWCWRKGPDPCTGSQLVVSI